MSVIGTKRQLAQVNEQISEGSFDTYGTVKLLGIAVPSSPNNYLPTITANSAFHSHLVIYTSKKSFPTRDCIKLAGSGNNNSML
jgi:hypothetical protein